MAEERTTGYASPLEACGDAERRAHHSQVLRDAVRYAYDGVPHYRAKLDAAGITASDVRGVEDLARIPVTPKTEAQAGGLGTGAVPLHEAKRIFVSPGPIFYASQRRTDPPYQPGRAPLALAFHAMGFREGDIVLNTFSYHLTPGGFGLEEQLTAAGCAVIPAGPQNASTQAQILAGIAVAGYVGTPTFLRNISDAAEEIGIKPRGDWSLQIAFVTAERLTEPMRAELEERTGARVRQIYGSADGLLPAYECWAAQGMHLHPDQITEVLDPQTWEPVVVGEVGAVAATAANPNRPLLRFANMDLVELRDDACPCGRTGPRIARFAGRVGSGTKVRGMFVYPEQIAQAMALHPEVERWQAVISAGAKGDEFTIRVATPAPGDALRDKIAEHVRGLVRLRAEIELVEPGAIPADAAPLDDRR